VKLSNNQRKAKYSKELVVFSPQGSQIIISLTLSLAFQLPYLEFRVPLTLGLSSEGDSIKHSSSLFRKTFIR